MDPFKKTLSLFLIIISFNGHSFSQSPLKDTSNAFFNRKINEWVIAFNSKKLGDYLVLLKDSIDYDGKRIDKYTYTEKKYLPIKKYHDLSVRIEGDINVGKLNDFQTKCSFKEILTYNDNSTEFPFYMVFEQRADDWLIAEICDSIVKPNVSNTSTLKDSSNLVSIYQTKAKTPSETANNETTNGASSIPKTQNSTETKNNDSNSDYGKYILGFILLGGVIYKLATGKSGPSKSSSTFKINSSNFTFPKKETRIPEVKNPTFEHQNFKSSKMEHNYLCKNCGRLPIIKESRPASPGCPSGGMHIWYDLGEIGNDNYQCSHCGVPVKSKNRPASPGCNTGGMHDWRKL